VTLGAIGHAVAEDICILTPAPESTYRLTAGLLCFPNRWKLTEKLGGSVLAVHGPVPDYAAHLTANVDRFLARLKPERAYIRSNWGLAGVPDLYVPEPTPPVDPYGAADVFLRREDQSFLKLRQTGAVIFGIRTHVQSWSETPENQRTAILKSIRGLSPAWLAYKSIHRGM
jgi:dimethylamine monooxygenase subunit A